MELHSELRGDHMTCKYCNISHVTGHVCTSVQSESVYSHIRLNRMWLLNGVRYNVWREGEKLPFAVWREVWNGVQLQLVDWTGMETSTHFLMC